MISSPARRGRGTACGGRGSLAPLQQYLSLPGALRTPPPPAAGEEKGEKDALKRTPHVA